MANLYYCHCINNGSGILRAVLTPDEAKSLLKKVSASFAGEQFPATTQEQKYDFAVLRIFDGELGEKWQAGFYRFGEEIAKIEEVVQASTTKLTQMGVVQARREDGASPQAG